MSGVPTFDLKLAATFLELVVVFTLSEECFEPLHVSSMCVLQIANSLNMHSLSLFKFRAHNFFMFPNINKVLSKFHLRFL